MPDELNTGLRIDWSQGRWRVWDLGSGAKLADVTRIVCMAPSEFVNCDNDCRGFGIVVGTVSVDGDTATIRRV